MERDPSYRFLTKTYGSEFNSKIQNAAESLRDCAQQCLENRHCLGCSYFEGQCYQIEKGTSENAIKTFYLKEINRFDARDAL